MAPRGPVSKPGKKTSFDKDSEEYRLKRERNNVAVKLSRERSRCKARETMERVARLKTENEQLERKVELLSKELSLLKDLFLTHAGGAPVRVKEEPVPVNDDAVQKDHQYYSAGVTVSQ